MNDLYKDKLRVLADDQALMSAISEVFISRITKEYPDILETDDNSLLGEKFRAYTIAKTLLKKCFQDLESYRVNKSPVKTFNKEE